jgi:hypothetical protein
VNAKFCEVKDKQLQISNAPTTECEKEVEKINYIKSLLHITGSELTDNRFKALDLSPDDQTGLKICPGPETAMVIRPISCTLAG